MNVTDIILERIKETKLKRFYLDVSDTIADELVKELAHVDGVTVFTGGKFVTAIQVKELPVIEVNRKLPSGSFRLRAG